IPHLFPPIPHPLPPIPHGPLRYRRVATLEVRVVLLVHRHGERYVISPCLPTESDGSIHSGHRCIRTAREDVVGREPVLPDHPAHVAESVRREEEPLRPLLEVQLRARVCRTRITQRRQLLVLAAFGALRAG